MEQLNNSIEVDHSLVNELLLDFKEQYKLNKIQSAYFIKNRNAIKVRVRDKKEIDRVFYISHDYDIENNIREAFTEKELNKIDGIGLFSRF